MTSNYEGSSVAESTAVAVANPYANSFIEEVRILVSRGLSNTFRTPELFLLALEPPQGMDSIIWLHPLISTHSY